MREYVNFYNSLKRRGLFRLNTQHFFIYLFVAFHPTASFFSPSGTIRTRLEEQLLAGRHFFHLSLKHLLINFYISIDHPINREVFLYMTPAGVAVNLSNAFDGFDQPLNPPFLDDP